MKVLWTLQVDAPMVSNARRLMQIIQTNDLDALRARIRQKRVLFAHQDAQGNRLLHWACEPDVSVDLLRLALSVADTTEINRFNKAHETPLMVAAWVGAMDHAELLLRHGAVVNEQAIDEVLPVLGSPDPRPRRVPAGPTALHKAASAAMANRLLDAGAHLETRDQMGFTPLLSAVQARRLDVLNVLLERGADPHATVIHLPGRATMMGLSALHIAMGDPNNGPLVERLLDVGVSPAVTLPNGTTPAALARQRLMGWGGGAGLDLGVNLAVLERWELTRGTTSSVDLAIAPLKSRSRL